jgi:hypothetical protein
MIIVFFEKEQRSAIKYMFDERLNAKPHISNSWTIFTMMCSARRKSTIGLEICETGEQTEKMRQEAVR